MWTSIEQTSFSAPEMERSYATAGRKIDVTLEKNLVILENGAAISYLSTIGMKSVNSIDMQVLLWGLSMQERKTDLLVPEWQARHFGVALEVATHVD